MNRINKIINWIKFHCHMQIDKQIKPSQYHSLTPTNCADNCEVYMDALQEALQNPDIKNVAVTGPYGSGKSSVIRTFFDRHNGEYKHITITLANFLDNNIQEDTTTQEQQEQTATKKGNNTPKGSEDTPKNNQKDTPQKTSTITGDDLEQLIERSIVQQLFYSVNDSSIPASHFKKIKKQDKFELFCIVLFILLCLLSVSYLLHPDILWSILKVKNVPVIIDNILRVLALFFAVWGIYETIKKVVQIAISISVKQLHIKEAGIELDKQEHKSILNYHIDEIIYFFEATEKNVVVIEDIDRFNHQGIFTKLREINYLINNCEKIHQKVVFIYALKDEMFQDKDRTKFFDFIIPIVPIINSSNSSEILRKEFLTDSQKTDITEDVINDISLFIDDMRLLYNIINEYKIYNQRMSAYTFDNNRLLAMIAYKNLFPRDFTQLSQGKGCLYNVIAQKDKYVRDLISKYEKEIESIRNKIKDIEEHEEPKNVQELRILYLSKVVDKLQSNFISFAFDNKRVSIYDCANSDDYFNKIRLGNIPYYYTDYYNNTRLNNQKISFSDVEKDIHPTMTYQQRVELLNQSQIQPLQKQLQSVENKIELVRAYSLKELIVEGKIKIADECKNKEVSKPDNNKQIEFIDILLCNGYINENYWDYISIFHEGSLTIKDKQFLINVKRRINTEFDHELPCAENLIRKIKLYEFNKPYILNDNLVDYILSDDYLLIDQTEERKHHLFTQLSMLRGRALPFVIHYLNRNQNIDKFLFNLCSQRRNIWKILCKQINDTNRLQLYFQQIIKYVPVEDVVNQFYMDETNYIENYAGYWLVECSKEKLKEIVQNLNIQFALLSKETSLEDLDYIYRSNAYQINIDVMCTILSKRENWNDLAFNTRNYSYIIENYPEMAKYIQENLSAYIDNVFLKLENNTSIDSAHFLELLNTDKLSEEQKKQIIRHLVSAYPFENIADVVSPSLWGEICENKLMAPNWDNIKTIMRSKEINYAKVYTDFFNNLENAEKLSTQKLEEDVIQDEGEVEIAYTLIYNDNICDESYRLLLNAFTDKYVLQPHNLPRNRMQWLIEKDLIEINTDSYKYLKENHTPLHLDFLEKHLAEFSKMNDQNFQFDAEDIMWILNSTIIIDEKQKIINTIVDTSILTDSNILEKLSAFILNSTNDDYVPNGNLIDYLAIQHELPIDVRKTIFIKYPQYVTDIKVFLTNLGEPYSSLLQKDIDTDIPIEDEVFLKTLQEHQYIGRFKKRRNRELWIIKKDAKLFR